MVFRYKNLLSCSKHDKADVKTKLLVVIRKYIKFREINRVNIVLLLIKMTFHEIKLSTIASFSKMEVYSCSQNHIK